MNDGASPHDRSDGARPGDSYALLSVVLSQWRLQLRRVPDAKPRGGDRGESEQVLLATLLRVSEADDDANLPALAAAAARYGALYPRQRVDPGALCDELAVLRNVLWEVLKTRDPGTHAAAVARILRFDRALSIVVRAAVRAEYYAEAVNRA